MFVDWIMYNQSYSLGVGRIFDKVKFCSLERGFSYMVYELEYLFLNYREVIVVERSNLEVRVFFFQECCFSLGIYYGYVMGQI